MLFRCLKGLHHLAIAALLVVMGTSIASGDLLSNDDFENDLGSTIANVNFSPFDLDAWGAESSFTVGPENGITPNLGIGMLRMFDDGLVATQVIQRVDVSQFAALIDSGDACVDFSVNFNAPDQPAAQAGISVFFIPEMGADDTNVLDSQIGASTTTQVLDSNPATWETVSIEGTQVPANTRSIVVQLSFNNASLNGTPGYADTTSMCIVECPAGPPPGEECRFDVCQALCVCENGELTGEFSVNGDFTNLQDIPGAFLLVRPNAMPEGVEACFGSGHTNIVLDEPLMNGDSVTLGSYLDDSTAVFLKNANSLDVVTFTLILIAADGSECCSVEVEVELPPCDCWQIDKRHDEFTDVVCNDDGTVDFSYTYSLRSLFTYEGAQEDAFYSFLIPLDGIYLEPDFFDIDEMLGAPLEFCDTTEFTTRVVGAVPGSEVNFVITLHAADVEVCCIRTQTITAPECSPLPDPPSSFLRGDMNEDGQVGLEDIGPFVQLLSSAGYHVIADINEDLRVDLGDVQPFVDTLLGQ